MIYFRTILFVVFCLFYEAANSQACPEYDQFMKEANKAASAKVPDYKKALANYTAARIVANDCGISDAANKAIDAKLESMFVAIDKKRLEAERLRKEAEELTYAKDSLLRFAVQAQQAAEAAKDIAVAEKARAEAEKKIAQDALREKDAAYKKADQYGKEADAAKTDLQKRLSLKSAKEFVSKAFKQAKYIRLHLLGQAYDFTPNYFESSRQLITSLGTELGSDLPANMVFLQDKAIKDAVFSPDGAYVVTGGDNMTVRIKKLYDTLPVFSLLRDAPVISVAFSPDNQTLMSLSTDKVIQLFNVVTKKTNLLTLDVPAKRIEFSPDGNYILVTCTDKTAQVYTLKGERVMIIQHSKPINYARFSPNSQYVITASADKSVRASDLTGRAVASIKHKNNVLCAEFSPDSKYFLSASTDKTAKLCDLSGKTITIIKHQAIVHDVAFSPMGTHFITASADRSAQLCDITGNPILVIQCPNPINNIDFSPNGQYIVAALTDGSAQIYDLKGKLFSSVQHEKPINLARFAPDNRLLLTISDDGSARLSSLNTKLFAIDSTTKENVFDPNVSKCLLDSVCVFRPINKQGTKLIMDFGSVTYKNSTVSYLNTKNKPFITIPCTQDVLDITISPNKQDILVITPSMVQILSPEGELKAIHAGSNITNAAFSSNGRYLIIRENQYTKLYLMEKIYISSILNILSNIKYWDVSEMSEQEKETLGVKEE